MRAVISLCLTVASATLYVLAACMCVCALLRKRDGLVVPSKIVFIVAVVAQSVCIGVDSVSTSGTLVTGPNILMLSSWVMVVATCFSFALSAHGYGFVALSGPLAAILMVTSHALDLFSAATTNSVYYEWPTLVVHVALVFLSVACFAIGAASSLMQLYQQNLIKKRSERLLQVRMPSVNTAAVIARRFTLAGQILLTAALLIGFARLLALHAAMSTVGCEGDLGYLFPRMALSLSVWTVYCVHLVLSYLVPHAVSSKARAALSVVGLVLAVVLVVVSAGSAL